MDKLRGRVRAGSHSSEMLTFRRGWVNEVPGPIVPGVGGDYSTTARTRHPEAPAMAESLLPPWPSPTVSFPGWEKGDKRKKER